MEKIRLIPLKFDKMYKKIFVSDDCKHLTDLLVKETTKINSKIVTLLNPEIINYPYQEKNTTVDLIAKLENEIIVGIELNASVNELLIKRNLFYMAKVMAISLDQAQSYKRLKKQIQVNLNFEGDYIEPIDYISLGVKGTDKIYTDALEIIRINIPYFVKMCYNKDVSKLSKKERLLGMIGSEDIELSRKLAKGDEILEMILDKQIKYSQDKDMGLAYDRDKLMKEVYEYSIDEKYKEGIEEGKLAGKLDGIKQGKLDGYQEGKLDGRLDEKINIVKNLLNMNIDITSISKATGLSIEEINNLK